MHHNQRPGGDLRDGRNSGILSISLKGRGGGTILM